MSHLNPVIDTKGSCIDFDLVYRDEAGNVEDVTDDSFSVVEAYPAALAAGVVTKTDPVNGTVHFHLATGDAAGLLMGNQNHLRIARQSPDGCVENSEQIWIKIV